MTKTEYRVKHSELIEECIYIEDLLKRFYGLVNGKGNLDDFISITDEIENDPMGKLISMYKNDKNKIMSNDLIEKLDKVRELRNYYVHRLFYQHTPFKGKEVRKPDVQKIEDSLFYIENVRDEFCELYDKKVAELKGE